MAEDLEMRFESLLSSTLKAEAGSLPVSVVPADILRRRDQTRRKHASRRLRLLLIAALIVLPLGALAVGALRTAPPPEGYSAVLVRTGDDPVIQVFTAREGVAERVLTVPKTRLDDAGVLDAAHIQVLETSATGWIAMYAATDAVQASGYREFVVLLNVRDPDAAPVVREGTSLGAWTPGGLYWSATNSAYELIDPASGEVTRLPRGSADPYGVGNGRMQVAADGHGLLLGVPHRWVVLSPDGTRSGGLPDVAEGVGPRHLSAQWGLLQRRSNGGVSSLAAGGTDREWGDAPPLHHYLADASWAVDGGVWLLVDRRLDGRTMVLIHRDQDNVDREIAAIPVDLDEDVRIGDLAADDSLIALELSGKWPVVQTVVVDTRSGSSHLFDGALGGFVPAASMAGWVAGERATEAGQLLTRQPAGGESGGAYGPLAPLQEHIDDLEHRGAERILLVHEVEATSLDPGQTIQLTLGPVELEEGMGISLFCSGPGHITLTETGPDGPEPPSTYGCLSPSTDHGYEAPNVRAGSVEVLVEFDPSTAWRLVIFDPPPHIPRP